MSVILIQLARAKRVCERKRTLSIFKKGMRLNFTYFRRKLSIFEQGPRLNFRGFAPQTASARFLNSNEECVSISQSSVENHPFSKKECASSSPIFTNFRRKLSVFKKGVRLNFTNFHKFSSKIVSFQIRSEPQFHKFSSKIASFQMRSAPQYHKFSSKIASFQIRSAPQFHRFSPIFVENGQFSNKECASISAIFTNFRRKLQVFK